MPKKFFTEGWNKKIERRDTMKVIVLSKDEIKDLLNGKVVKMSKDSDLQDTVIVESDKWHKDIESGDYKDYEILQPV